MMVTYVFRRANTTTPYPLDSGGSSGESSRQPSVADISAPRRPSLTGLSLRLSSRSKRSKSQIDTDTACEHTSKIWESLFLLPDEITAQILCNLSTADIFALRLTSRSVHTYLQCHAGPLTRSLLLQSAYEHTTEYEGTENHDKALYLYKYIQTIYPPPQPCTSFDYLLQMLRRQSQIQKMLAVLTSWLQMKVYIFPKFKRCENFNPYKHKLVRRLHVAAWTMQHFLESYRNILVHQHPSHRAKPPDGSEDVHGRCFWCLESIKKLLRAYPQKEIIPAYHFYELSRQHLHTLSRAPSAGRLRAKKSSSNADLMQLIVFGGIAELCKLSLLKGSSNQRIDVISTFAGKISSAAVQQRIRANGSSPPSAPPCDPLPEDLIAPVQTPFHLLHKSTIAALPALEHFITGMDEWLIQMYLCVSPTQQITGAWGFITNILTGKSDDGTDEAGQEVPGQDSDLDFLSPVKDFDD